MQALSEALRRFHPFNTAIQTLAGYIGVFGLVWAAMTGIASSVEPISQYGWGVVVFAGLGVACVLVLAISIGLVAWRYFNPITIAPGVQVGRPTVSRESNESVLSRHSSKIDEIDRSLSLLIGATIDSTTLDRVSLLMRHLPQVEEDFVRHAANDELSRKSALIEQYLGATTSRLAQSRWREDLEQGSQFAQHEIDIELREEPDVPPNLNPFEYRRYRIAERKLSKTYAVLQKALEEELSVKENYRNLLRDRIAPHK